ncbi:MAG TPA: plastocyanin/azurin family copper-binding protein [candidate division Zixibacteria bacterium]|nr:plastocyanin/azurin family copper-binding protein [candidate division Zixibacteria bacterium]
MLRLKYFPAVFIALLTASPAWGKIDTVRVMDFRFVPAALTIQTGDTVLWRVFQQCCIEHSTTRSASPMSWNSGDLALGDTFQLPFPDTGTFNYFCIPHQGIGMIGSITVQPRPPAPPVSTMGQLGLALLLASLAAAAIWILEHRRKTA